MYLLGVLRRVILEILTTSQRNLLPPSSRNAVGSFETLVNTSKFTRRKTPKMNI